MGCLFTLLTIFFAVQKSFGLMWSHVSIFASVTCVFGVMSMKSLLKSMQRHSLLQIPLGILELQVLLLNPESMLSRFLSMVCERGPLSLSGV